MKRLTAILTIAGAIAALAPARPVWACSCAFSSPREAARHAEAIFAGRAISSAGDQSQARTQFAVETVYKGSVGSGVTIRHAVQETACGLVFDEGQLYTVFAYQTGESEELQTNICWPTSSGPIDPDRFNLQASPVAQSQEQPAPGDADEVWPLWALLGGLVLAIGGLATWTTRRRRR